MNYTELDVYQRAYRLAKEIHEFSFTLPKILQFDLGDQIRRASRSIPSGIAEGFGRRKSSKDTANLLNGSLGSVEELLFNIEFMHDMKLMDDEQHEHFRGEYTIVGKQLYRLIQSLDRKFTTRH